ncbi:phage baseplate assembly protein V [Pseudoxanthomonas sp. PXM02]|uniref:phage baseplate assembly protein V n=1 Tax=Pseudoxanthomonas sp. PXM02 TaxID=2769294 RepID=UPI00177CEFFF|nr:phage baseplate assembly protein V [Pseudoxanthomonas sp. PXM02]MBD9478522.1 phage baseplate assembly protein V [Pseudoxanthomonas sp. PXM02]
MESARDIPRQSLNQIRLGTVAEVDLARALCRVSTGEIVTDFIPWLVPRAGAVIEWSAPSAGEQVMVLAPGGDVNSAVAVRGIYSNQHPAPAHGEALHLVKYPDGALIQYDHASHALTATLPGGGTAEITADGGVTINGPLTVNGDTQINGDTGVSKTLTAQTDVIGGGKSLKNHRHTGVQTGGGVSGPPQ